MHIFSLISIAKKKTANQLFFIKNFSIGTNQIYFIICNLKKIFTGNLFNSVMSPYHFNYVHISFGHHPTVKISKGHHQIKNAFSINAKQ